MSKLFYLLFASFLSSSLMSCNGKELQTKSDTLHLNDSSSSLTSKFHGVNWADPRDNYVDGWLLLSGLQPDMNYAECQTKGGKIVDGFISNMGATNIRIPINPQTAMETWWNSYTGAIDISLSKGMSVILTCWEGNNVKDGKVDNMKDFWTMWKIVTTKYADNPNVYFEILNEPFGYTQTEWGNICEQWLSNYPTIPKGRILVGGTGYDDNVTGMGADPRFSECLLSQHMYAWWGNYKTENEWKQSLQERVGIYYNRTILTEYGAAMTTGKIYTTPKDDIEICFIRGMTEQIRVWGIGSCYWPGLRNGDSYSIQSLNMDSYNLSTTNPSGLNRIKWGWRK